MRIRRATWFRRVARERTIRASGTFDQAGPSWGLGCWCCRAHLGRCERTFPTAARPASFQNFGRADVPELVHVIPHLLLTNTSSYENAARFV